MNTNFTIDTIYTYGNRCQTINSYRRKNAIVDFVSRIRRWGLNFLYNCWNCLIDCKINCCFIINRIYCNSRICPNCKKSPCLCRNNTVSVAIFIWRWIRENNLIWIFFLVGDFSPSADEFWHFGYKFEIPDRFKS